MSEFVKEVSDGDFQKEVMESPIPVVVDFWAPWCGPCKAFAPTFGAVAEEFVGKVKFIKVNVDESPEVSAKLQIRSIPTMMIFSKGEVEGSKVGALSRNQFTAFLGSVV